MNNPILVCGAAGGTQGATRHLVARLLRQRSVPVRALVHRLDQRSEALRAVGAEVVQADLLDLASVGAALTGVRRAYFTYPVQDGLMEATAIFAAAAREAGVEQVVNLSQLLRRADLPTPRQRQHWLSENVFNWAQVGAVHLDAAVFFENLLALARRSVPKTGALLLPWGPPATVFPMVAGEDVARVAVGVLTAPPLENGTVVPLVGESISVGKMAEAFSDVLNRAIAYREIADEQWIQGVTISGANLNAHALEHLSKLWRYLRTRSPEEQRNYPAPDPIEKFGGAKPETFREFLHQHAGALQPAVG